MMRFGGWAGWIAEVDWGGRPAFEWRASRIEMKQGERGHVGGR